MGANMESMERGSTDTFLASVMWRVEAHLDETLRKAPQVTANDVGKVDAPLAAALSGLLAGTTMPTAELTAQLRQRLSEYLARASEHRTEQGDEVLAKVIAHFGGALVDLSDAARELGFWSSTERTADTSTLEGTYDGLDAVLDGWAKAPGRVDEVTATRLHHLLGNALRLAPGDEVVATYLRDRLAGMREHLADRRDRKRSLQLFDAVLADYPALR